MLQYKKKQVKTVIINVIMNFLKYNQYIAPKNKISKENDMSSGEKW